MMRVTQHPAWLRVATLAVMSLVVLSLVVFDLSGEASRELSVLSSTPTGKKVMIIGGTGRIGTATAAHLLLRKGATKVVLAGRNEAKGLSAVAEVLRDAKMGPECVWFRKVDWRDRESLQKALSEEKVDAVVHTAGPYNNEHPEVLRTAINLGIPVYVDVSDPIPYLEAAKAMGPEAEKKGTIALCSAGAFPGLSNVLAMECAGRLGEEVKDLDFSYFTAGLGGSGDVNLLITNEGFGEPMLVFRGGKLTEEPTAGLQPRRVKFYLHPNEKSADLVGERTVWNWPFPESATVASELKITGDSSIGMGTAPDIWNVILGGLVSLVPRPWWRSRAFSTGLAKFSEPMVKFTDQLVGETHAMRIDVEGKSGRRVSAVQAHESFRQIVGQSCAEFTTALLEGLGEEEERPAAGVFTPETLFAKRGPRSKLLDRMLHVKGTLNYGFEESLSGSRVRKEKSI